MVTCIIHVDITFWGSICSFIDYIFWHLNMFSNHYNIVDNKIVNKMLLTSRRCVWMLESVYQCALGPTVFSQPACQGKYFVLKKYFEVILMAEYEFVVVQMSKINARVLRFFHPLSNARTQRVSALWCEKNQRTKALNFDICTSTNSYQSLTSFIQVIKYHR